MILTLISQVARKSFPIRPLYRQLLWEINTHRSLFCLRQGVQFPLDLARHMLSRNSFTASITRPFVCPLSPSSSTILSLPVLPFTSCPTSPRNICLILILSLSYFLHSRITFCTVSATPVRHLAHFAAGLQPSIVPGIHVHTLRSSMEKEITSQAYFIPHLTLWGLFLSVAVKCFLSFHFILPLTQSLIFYCHIYNIF